MVVGVDGCKGGWIAATRRGARRIDALELLLREALPDLVAVDIPVGLSDAGPRRCDQEARALLRGRASSVFRAPIRPMLAARSQSEASALGRSLDGKGISAQSWAITGKIREVDELLRRDGKARRA
ncbi:MAG TPA: DUF429 domain-containing protein, partial [Myxococcota bacterium]|nr:DUF429 domain-containing protein [Myxococcota bacterium]